VLAISGNGSLENEERKDAMKTHAGEEIVCKCTQPAGNFRHNVEDHASISSDDIAISPDLPVPDADHRVLCPTCEETVAQRFSGDRWGVNTKKGWLK
jgi:hypothetical protein